MNKLIWPILSIPMLFCAYIISTAFASGPNVSLGSLPAHTIYYNCSNGSLATLFTNTSNDTFLITDVWATTSAPGGNGAADVYIGGTPTFALSATSNRSMGLTTQTGIPVAPAQSIECQRMTSYGVKITIIGKYVHTP